MEQGRQELYGALVQGLQGMHKTLRDREEVQRACPTRCLQPLAQEIRDRWVLPREQPGGCGRKGRSGRGKQAGMGQVGEALVRGLGDMEGVGVKRSGRGYSGGWEYRRQGRWEAGGEMLGEARGS